MSINLKSFRSGLDNLIKKYHQLQKNSDTKKLNSISEANVRKDFIDPFFELLGYNIRDSREYDAEKYIRKAGFVDIAIKINGEYKIFIEAKRFGGIPKTSEERLTKNINGKLIRTDFFEEERQVLNYAAANNIRWCILTNFETFRVFNSIGLTIINIESVEEYINRIEELFYLSKKSLISGRIDNLESRIEKPDIDLDFLELMNHWRLNLAKSIYTNNQEREINFKKNIFKFDYSNDEKKKDSLKIIKESTQRILDRLIIVRFAEDRFVIEPDQLKALNDSWKKTKTYTSINDMLKQFFRTFDTIHNSKIFESGHICEIIKLEDKIISEIIDDLYKISFRKFTSDILGNTYESYLGHELVIQKENLKLEQNETLKKSEGIYYTPKFIVNYILNYTLGLILNSNYEKVEKLIKAGEFEKGLNEFYRIKSIKILDPSCGSGSFLISAYNLIFSFYEKLNNLIQEINIKLKKSSKNKNIEIFFKQLNPITNFENTILEDNLFGVDIDPQAVEITSVNLILRFLKRNEKLPLILEENIRRGNSIVGGKNKELLKNFGDDLVNYIPFDYNLEFSDIMSDSGFDLIIGNPPYLLIQPQDNPDYYLNYIQKSYSSAQYKIDIYHLFIEKGLNLLKEGGFLGFIVPNTFLTNVYTSNLRKLILNTSLIKEIVIVSNVFKGAEVDNAIIILEKSENEALRKDNYIDVNFSKDFNDLASDTIDYEKVFQGDFYKNKNLEFTLLKNEEFRSIFDIIESKSVNLGDISRINFGLQTPNRKLYPDSVKIIENEDEIVDPYKPCITGKDINRYQLEFKNRYVFYDIDTRSGGCWDPEMHFNNKKIIVRQIGKYPIAAIDNYGYACLNTAFMIVSAAKEYDIEYLIAFLNSNLIKFYWHYNFSDYKTLFPKIKKANLVEIPIYSINHQSEKDKKIYNSLCSVVKELLELYKELKKISLDFTDYSRAIPYNRKIRLGQFFDKMKIIKKKYHVPTKEKSNFSKMFIKLKENRILISELYQGNHKKLMDIISDDKNVLEFLLYTLKHSGIKGKLRFIDNILKIEIPEYREDPKENLLEISNIIKNYNQTLEDNKKLVLNIKKNEKSINLLIYNLFNFNSEIIDLIENFEI